MAQESLKWRNLRFPACGRSITTAWVLPRRLTAPAMTIRLGWSVTKVSTGKSCISVHIETRHLALTRLIISLMYGSTCVQNFISPLQR